MATQSLITFAPELDPAYGYTVSLALLQPRDLPPFEVGQWVHKQNEQKYGFMSRLRESILTEGFRNPIVVFKGDGNDRIPYGQSRASVAKQLGIDIPAIVCDWTGKLWGRPLTTIAEVRECYRDQPTVVEFTSKGLNVWGCRQVQLRPEDADWFQTSQMKRDKARPRGLPLRYQSGGPHGNE